MLANERAEVRWTLDTSQPEIEDELRYARRRLDLRLQNVRLQRIQQALIQQVGRNLICNRLPSFNEQLVGDPFRLRRVYGHADCREDVEVVSLSRQERLSVILHRRELDTGCVNRFAFWPGISLLGPALG